MKQSISFEDGWKPFAEAWENIAHPKQVMCLTATVKGDDPEESAHKARQYVLKWIGEHGYPVPQSVWEHSTYDSDLPGTPVRFRQLQHEGNDWWIVRFDHLDNQGLDMSAKRMWSTEISVIYNKDICWFALSQRISGTNYGFSPAVPRVVRTISDELGMAGKIKDLSSMPVVVETEDDVHDMIEILRAPARQQPVFVISETPSSKYLIDPRRMAVRTIGLARVYKLEHKASFFLSEELGKELSVFGGAVRTYQPGFDPFDNPMIHPLALPDTIKNWAGGGAKKFVEFLAFKSAELSLEINKAPSFSSASRIIAEEQHKAAVAAVEAEDNIDNLKKRLGDADRLIVNLRNELQDWTSTASEEEEKAKFERKRAQEAESRVLVLRSQIAKYREQYEIVVPIPDNFNEIKRWADEYLEDRVTLTSRAVKAAKNPKFEDPELAYRALLLLGNEYRNMRINGSEDNRKIFEEKCRDLGLRNTRSGKEIKLREQGEEFLVDHRGQKRLLEFHLKNGGNTRIPERCFRLYYFWDDEEQVPVVGSLPGHLRTRAS